MTVLQSEILDDISHHVTNPAIQRLNDRWWSLCQRGEVPLERDFAVKDLAWCDQNLMLLEAIGNDDFRYLYYGSGIAAVSQFDMTGKCVSGFRSEVGEFFRRKYVECLSAGQPIYTRHHAQHASAVTTWERLLLPLRCPDGNDFVLAYNHPVELRHELLENILESSIDGIAHYRTLRNDEGDIVDFQISILNEVAAGIPICLPNDSDSDAIRLTPIPKLFERFCDVVISDKPQRFDFDFECDGEDIHYRVSAVKTGDGVTVTFSDFSELRRRAMELQDLNLSLEEQKAELSYSNEMLEQQAAEMGRLAEDRETARLRFAEANRRLEHEISERSRLEEELRLLATTNSLTGALNRRAFMELAEAEFSRAQRYARPLTIVMIDIDHFKSINDQFGHATGDEALRVTRSICEQVIREQDAFGRLGGEEFAVVLPETDMRAAKRCAERIRTAIEARVLGDGCSSFKMTASLGLASLTPYSQTMDEILHRADQALYRAKGSGRNRIEQAA